MTQLTPGMAFSPSTISVAARDELLATIASTSSCGPVRAAIAPACAKALVHETLLIISRLYAGISQLGHDPVAEPPAGHRVGLARSRRA